MKYRLIIIFNLFSMSLFGIAGINETIDEFGKRLIELFEQDDFTKFQNEVFPSKNILNEQLREAKKDYQLFGNKLSTDDEIEYANYEHTKDIRNSAQYFRNSAWIKIKINENYEPIVWERVSIIKTESNIQTLKTIKSGSTTIFLEYKNQQFILKLKGTILDLDGKWKLTKSTKYECSCSIQRYIKRDLYPNPYENPSLVLEFKRLNEIIVDLNKRMDFIDNHLNVGLNILSQKKDTISQYMSSIKSQNAYLDTIIQKLIPFTIIKKETHLLTEPAYFILEDLPHQNSKIESQIKKYEKNTNFTNIHKQYLTYDNRTDAFITHEKLNDMGHFEILHDLILLKEYKLQNNSILLQMLINLLPMKKF